MTEDSSSSGGFRQALWFVLSFCICLCTVSVIQNERQVFSNLQVQSLLLATSKELPPHRMAPTILVNDSSRNIVPTVTSKMNPKRKPLARLTRHIHLNHTSATDVPHFQRQEGVVIVTKIHGPHQFTLAAQSLCLMEKAYNSRLNYDIVVFTTESLNHHEVGRLQQLVYPSNLTVVLDSHYGFHEEFAAISPKSF